MSSGEKLASICLGLQPLTAKSNAIELRYSMVFIFFA
jgi:hypothetical protein